MEILPLCKEFLSFFFFFFSFGCELKAKDFYFHRSFYSASLVQLTLTSISKVHFTCFFFFFFLVFSFQRLQHHFWRDLVKRCLYTCVCVCVSTCQFNLIWLGKNLKNCRCRVTCKQHPWDIFQSYTVWWDLIRPFCFKKRITCWLTASLRERCLLLETGEDLFEEAIKMLIFQAWYSRCTLYDVFKLRCLRARCFSLSIISTDLIISQRAGLDPRGAVGRTDFISIA